MKKIAVLTGAGISAESGLKTFRDSGGLWEGYSIEEVATPEAWKKNPKLVLDFYNERRKALLSASPNTAHCALVELEKYHDVTIITQNVDDLHERAGSKNVLHLHGELKKSRSTIDESLIYPVEGWELSLGMTCEKGSQLRPHIVWFGEMVPMIDQAIKIIERSEIMLVIGTSLSVYPAASLVDYFKGELYLVDPKKPLGFDGKFIEDTAVNGVPKLVESFKDI